jgi:hypothetical protein
MVIMQPASCLTCDTKLLKFRAHEKRRTALESGKAALAAVFLTVIFGLPYRALAAPVSVPTTTNLAMAAGTNYLASGASVPSGAVLTFVASVNSGATN